MLDSLFKRYRNELENDLSLSPRTREAYLRDIQPWVEHLKVSGSPVSTADPAVLRSFLAVRRRAGVEARSLARFLSALRHFQQFLERARGGKKFVFHVPKLKFAENLPEHLTIDEAKRLVAFENGAGFLQQRNQLLALALYLTGLRRQEIADLKIRDIECGRERAQVSGKGGKVRSAPLGEALRGPLADYLVDRHNFLSSKQAESAYLFVNSRGAQLSTRSIDRIILNLGKSRLGRRVTPHMLRHSFATHMLDAGADLMAIKEILGHSSLSTTQKYTKVSSKRLKEAYSKAHPRA